MNFTEEQIAVFRAYLSGDMPDLERNAFEKQLSEDDELKGSFEDFQEFENALRDAETVEIYDQVGGWEASHQTKKPAGKIRTLWIVAASIAAVVIATFLIWQPNAEPSSEEMVASYFEPYDNVITVRGKKEVLDKALLAYDQKKYQKALELFNQYPDDSIAVFYRAETLMALKKYDASIKEFDRVIQQNDIFTEVAQFHQALAFLGNGQRNNAIKALKSISKDSFYYDKARDLLKKL